MASTFGNRSDHISNTRQAATQLIDAVNKLRALKREWDAGMGTWLVDATGDDPTAEGYNPYDFAGANAGLMKADISAVTGTTLTAFETLLAAGHATNLEKIAL
jgi:hypothetical protein